MAALPEIPSRRRRYSPVSDTLMPSLTPRKRQPLEALGLLGFASLPQVARLMGLSEKASRRHVRPLFDAGLITIIPVHRAALAPTASNDAGLLGGSAPNIFRLTRAGVKLLKELQGTSPESVGTTYGPRNSLFLAHALAVRDVFIWLRLIAHQTSTCELLRWQMDETAWIDLKRTTAPHTVRPDSWFVLKVGEAVLVGLVEVDRGTERGTKRWQEKIAAYTALFHSSRLKETTGYQYARVLVLTPSISRRDNLATLLATHAPADLVSRFWLADQTILQQPTLTASVWRQPGSSMLRPLVTGEAQHA